MENHHIIGFILQYIWRLPVFYAIEWAWAWQRYEKN